MRTSTLKNAVLLYIPVFVLSLAGPAPSDARSSANLPYRDPRAAFAIALGPGALFHGAGNYYGGQRKTAALLFALEVFGAGMILSDKRGDGRGLGGRETILPLGVAGQVLFFGSYLFDVLSAPDAAASFNERQRRNAELTFRLESPRGDRYGHDSLQPTFRYTRRF